VARWPVEGSTGVSPEVSAVGTLEPVVPGVRRIAVLRANSIGDFVLTLPALDALHAAYPRAEITVLGASWHRQALDGRPGPWARVVEVPPYPGLGGQVPDDPTPDLAASHEFFASQRAVGYDIAVQLHGGGARSNPFVSSLGARLTIGARDHGASELDRYVHYGADQHDTLRCLEIVAQVGARPVRLEPWLEVTDADRSAALRVLPASDRRLVVVHPGANDARRRWSASRFGAVVTALVGDGCDAVVVGAGPDDEKAGQQILSSLGVAAANQATSLVGRLSFSALVGVLERADLVVSNDSGPRHVAAAVGTASASVYWVGNLLTAGPLSRDRHRVLVSYRTLCPVCGTDQTGYRCEHDCSYVDDVPVEAMVAEARSLLSLSC
jgi:ADP-heptose:LPS heptosyltransferase